MGSVSTADQMMKIGRERENMQDEKMDKGVMERRG